jgi:hypothetical protein
LEVPVQACRQAPQANPRSQCRGVTGSPVRDINPLIPSCREKPLARTKVTVPQTDTGRLGENPKAHERTLVQELGKMPP